MGNCICKIKRQRDSSVKHYLESEFLGSGGTSLVYKVRNIKTNKIYTCKKMPIKYKSRCKREAWIMQKFASEHMPKFHALKFSHNMCYLYYGYIPGHDIFDECMHITPPLSMGQIKTIFYGMLNCIIECHEHNIAHLDIKCENFVYDKTTGKVSLVDLGSAHYLLARDDMFVALRACGTRAFMAPELWLRYYHKNTDVWSLGICLWGLLTRAYPFNGFKLSRKDPSIELKLTRKLKFPMIWHKQIMKRHKFSKDLRDLLIRMLTFDAHERITLSEVKYHDWMLSDSVL